MPVFSTINVWAVLVAAASAFMLGGLWYGPLFLKAWGRAAGVDGNESPKHPGRTFGTAFMLSLVAATAMAFALPKNIDALHGAGLGALIGLLFVATSFGINYVFARRPMVLWLIDGGYHVVQFLLYGAILGAWH